MSSRRFLEHRAAIVSTTVVAASLVAVSAFADPLVGETTSKVLTTVAHIIVERVGGSTLDRIVGPYIDDTLAQYLRGNPAKIQPALEQQRDQISQRLGDSAEKDIPILKAQLALLQNEITAVKALQQPGPSGEALTQASTSIKRDTTQIVKDIDQRDVQLASVEKKLDDVATRFQEADAAPDKAPAPAATLKPPSFDCRKAKTEMEHLICDNPKLADIDGRLGEVYWELRHFLSPSESEQLRQQEIAWIKRRVELLKDNCTRDDGVHMPCVIALWKDRIDQLEAQLQNAKDRKL